jgi:hypothetical protein
MDNTLLNKMDRRQAVARLWHLGILYWKLEPVQKDLYDSFTRMESKILVWSCSRRLGKSYALSCIAIEKCLQKPNTIVKFIAPTQKHVKNIIRPLLKQIFVDCPNEIRPEFRTADNLYRFKNGSEIQLAGTDSGHAEGLRGGCLSGDTLIMTEQGPVEIRDIIPGDMVYGVNLDGSISLTKVKNVGFTGNKEVTEIMKKNVVIGASTNEHKWIIRSDSNTSIKDRKEIRHEKQFSDINVDNSRFVRYFIDVPCGELKEPHAYAIGAFIGDGCATDKKGTKLYLASKDDTVPSKIAKVLDLKFKKIGDYKYTFGTTNEHYKHTDEIHFNHYNEWIKGKYWYEKTFDWDVVNLWDRDSCLELLAGLIDTDGSVHFGKKDKCIEVSYNSSSPILLENINKLLLKLFQVRGIIKQDNRKNKYTRDHFRLRIRSSLFSKRILKELSPYLVRENKQYKPEYDESPCTENKDYIKLTKGKTYVTDTYDIEIENETHLYLTADGLVTHNSADLCIVDEAGFCDDLKYIVSSILIPTTTTTRGKIILSSTPPKHFTHEFVDYIQSSKIAGNYVMKTIYDGIGPRLPLDEIEKIKEELGGENSPDFQREYLCSLQRDEESTVVPEFTAELQGQIVKDWPRPPHYDIYVAGDIGFKDFTVFLFAYYDFKMGKIIIEDELVMNGKSMTTDALADAIKKKEKLNFTNNITKEQQKPYLRVSDNNLILINDLQVLHGLTINPTAKDDSVAALNNMKILLRQERVIINPRCKTLINHLEFATWNKNQTSYARFEGHHYDAVDAIKYLCRAVQQNKNPYPANWGNGAGDSWWNGMSAISNSNKPITQSAKTFENVFNIKNKFKYGRK